MFRVIAATYSQEMSSNAAPSMISIAPRLLFCLTERFARGSRGDRPLNRTEKRRDSTARERKKNSSASVGGEPGGTSGSIHGLGYLFSALRRKGLIADELVLQLATFLRSLDLFLQLTVRTVPRTLTTNQVRRGGQQGTDDPELSRIHSRTQHPRDKRREASAHGAAYRST
jgi:hypothetical protein